MSRKPRSGNPLGNPGSRTDVLCKGVTEITPTPQGFVVVCRRIEIGVTPTPGEKSGTTGEKPA